MSLKISPTKRDLGVLADSKLCMRQLHALAVRKNSHTLGCIRHNTATGRGKGLSCCALLGEVSPPALGAGWVAKYRKDIKLLEGVQRIYEDGEESRGQDV